jgi:hypothetical protein
LAGGRVERGGLIRQPWNKNEQQTEQIRVHANVTECASFLCHSGFDS